MTVETLVGGGGVILLGVVGFFLKKTHDKIDATSAAVNQIGRDVDARIDKLEIKMEVETKASKTEIVQIFQDICHERQDSCGKLQTAKLEKVETVTKAACAKVDRLTEDRDRKWHRQEELNERFKEHILRNGTIREGNGK